MTLKWHFPRLDHGVADGFNDPLQEHFQGNHEYFIARETIQNALDAKDDKANGPVTVEFEVSEIRTDELPGSEELKATISRCISYNSKSPKALTFFRDAEAILTKPRVQLLRIGDYNTTGLTGGETKQDGGNWYDLLQSVGNSEMTGHGGGSFGIGKGAPFAASSLKYVLYSTRTAQGVAFQGKAILTSHIDDGEEFKGTGFWGLDGYKAIRDESLIPKNFVRESLGTDVFVAGYRHGGQWQEVLMQSVLVNFWAAIHFGDLEVKFIDNKNMTVLNADNLAVHLEQLSNVEGIKKRENPWYFYQAVTDPTTVAETTLEKLGPVKLYIKTADDYPRAVQMMRLPKMVVQTKGPHGVLPEGYSGVFLLEASNKDGNELLRKLEPPKHDEWDKYRGKDAKINGWAIINELEAWVKESLRGLNKAYDSEVDEITGLNQILPDDESLGSSSTIGDEQQDLNELESANEITQLSNDKPKKVVTRPIALKPSDAGGEKPRRPEPGEGSGNGGGGGGGGDDIGGTKRIDTSSITIRSFPIGDPIDGKYKLIIYSTKKQLGAIRLIGAGDDADYALEINGAETPEGVQLPVDGSFVHDIEVEPKKQAIITVHLKTKRRFVFPVGVESYVN